MNTVNIDVNTVNNDVYSVNNNNTVYSDVNRLQMTEHC